MSSLRSSQWSFIDCHVHTMCSHDSEATPEELTSAVVSAGFGGFMITDHIDVSPFGNDFVDTAFNSYKLYKEGFPLTVTEEMRREGFRILFGLEIGESIRNPEKCKKIISEIPLDAVLGSVHKIYIDGRDFNFSDYRFSELPPELVRRIVVQYYSDVLRTANESDVDVLSHLNLINRYNCDYTGGDLDDPVTGPIIREILKTAVAKDIVLEINTSGIAHGMFMPGPGVLTLYKSMGGSAVTLGSDTHRGDDMGRGFKEAEEMIRDIGLERVYFVKRKAVSCFA